MYRHLLLLGVILMLSSMAALTGWGVVSAAAEPKTLDRNLEPVVVSGGQVNALNGARIDHLFVFTFTNSGLGGQIPVQVDKKTAGNYVSTAPTDALDGDDEIVFMAGDAGSRAADPTVLTATLPISTAWYEIEISDPLSGKRGWAYLVRSASLSAPSIDYVGYNTGTRSITAAQYLLGFAATEHSGLEYLSLNGSGVDILDRTKLRVTQGFLTLTENFFDSVAPNLIRDGQVRVILQQNVTLLGNTLGTTYKAYAAAVEVSAGVSSSVTPTSARSSIDFSSVISPATFYNANLPGGVTVNGIADETVAATPLSRWFQVSHSTGRLIQVTNPSPVGGTQSNFYRDNNTPESSDDTGVDGAYGESGFLFTGGVNSSFTLQSNLFVLPSGPDNVGATYETYFFNPLQTCAALTGSCTKIFLPVIFKGG